MQYIRLFTSTAWRLYFLYKDSLYKGKNVAEISLDIKDHLGFLFEQQGRDIPDLSEMVKDLKDFRLRSYDGSDSQLMNEFIDKYTDLFTR